MSKGNERQDSMSVEIQGMLGWRTASSWGQIERYGIKAVFGGEGAPERSLSEIKTLKKKRGAKR